MATKFPIPAEFAQEICSVQPMVPSLIKALINAAEPPELLPKHWEPSKEYVEISRGIGIDYQERVVPKHDAKSWIHAGWSITRLSKISPSMVKTKWINAIIAMEKTS